MNKALPTVIVKGNKGQPLILNESDFDSEKHELYDGKEESTIDKKALKAFLDEKKVAYPKNISEKKLVELYEETVNTLSIVEKDGRFVIANGKGELVGDDSYGTEDEAATMLKIFTGK